ncbi:nitrogen regulation protein NR(II) [Vibrio sp.]|nr:nitrogen regulation protein NR(II) [Vibrio sp.]
MDNIEQDVLNHIQTAIITLDDNFAISYANQAAQQLLQQSLCRLKGSTFLSLVSYSTFDFKECFQRLTPGDVINDYDATLVINGTHTELDVAINFYAPEPEYYLIELHVITHKNKISQTASQHLQQQAAQHLVRGLAHEIKNPLGGLRGAAQLLERQLPQDELKEFTQMIIEQADRLRSLVDNLLGPQKPIVLKEQNIHLVIEKARQVIEYDHRHIIPIQRDYDPSLPELCIDSDLIQQVLLNILTNAMNALDNQNKARVTIRTRSEMQVNIHGVHHRTAARIDIIDNGPGIPNDIQDTLFYPMVTRQSGGSGLGLSIAQTIIEQHKGKIDVDSWPGSTTFSIFLPLT